MRVLIVDDHEIVRRGVRSLLSVCSECEICGEAVNGEDAIEKTGQLTPDVIVMDISMPKLNGLEATRRIRQLFPQTEVLMLSQHESDEMVRQAFNAGARGYVVKGSIARDLVTALETVSRHEPFFDPSISGTERCPPPHNGQEILQRSAALEQALRESEELYRSTFELAAVGVAHLSLDGKFLRANKKLGEILGYSPSELIKLKYKDVTHPADLSAEKAELESVVAGETEQFASEKRYIRDDGSTVWVKRTVSALRGADRRMKHFIFVVEDITERKEAEVARSRLAAIVESSDDAIVSKDLNGVITSWNTGAERIFEYSAEEAVGKSITMIIPADLQDEEKEILRRLRAGQRIEHFETVRVTKSGKKVDVSLTVSPVRDSRGVIVGASKIARDITERKEAELAQRELREQLEARVRERTADLQEKNAELSRHTDLVRELSARLLQSQDEERRRIARELHDSAGQIIAALQINLQPLESKIEGLGPDAARALRDSIGLVAQLSRELRTISHLLHPPLLDESGLASALRWYIEGYADRSKIAVDLQLSPDLGRLSREIETAIFRMIQECLTNIHRHSGSPSAAIRVDRFQNEVRVEVRDEGKGIRVGPRALPLRPGVGIQGMQERVRQLGGQFQIHGESKGTVVMAVIPIPESSASSQSSPIENGIAV